MLVLSKYIPSKRVLWTSVAESLMVGMLFAGLEVAGLFGALVGQGIAMVLAYPVVIWLSRSTGAWDRAHDAVMALAGAALIALVVWLNQEAIAGLIAAS